MVTLDVPHRNDYIKIRNELWQEMQQAVKHVQKHTQDLVLVVDGDEGSGKSHTARQLGYGFSELINQEFTSDNIYHDVESYKHDSINSDGIAVRIMDESREIVGSASAVTKKSRKFMDFLSECRSLQQIHIIILPAFHDLNKYIVLWRMNLLIHMYKNVDDKGELTLGNSVIYARDDDEFGVDKYKDDLLYAYESGTYQYPDMKSPTWLKQAAWNGTEVLREDDLQEYEEQKHTKLKERYDPAEQEDDGLDKYQKSAAYFFDLVCEESPMTQDELCADAPMTTRTYRKLRNRWKENSSQKKEG